MVLRVLLTLLFLVAHTAHADIIMLLSDDKPSIMGVAKAISAAYSEKVEIHNMGGSRQQENEIVHAVNNSSVRHVVAVGLQAAQLARQRLQSKQVVFCQVLNFEEFDLITPSMKGVSGIPSLAAQFAAWKLLDPGLRRIGVITGKQARYMVHEADAAARRNGLELVHVQVPSDRAVPLAVQELYEKKIQGLWLAPDSSILSHRAILDLMSYSVKNNLQVLAFSPALLKEGAVLSATPDFAEIARLVLERLKKSSDSSTLAGDAITSLVTARIIINANAASRFGLTIPAKLREQADVQ